MCSTRIAHKLNEVGATDPEEVAGAAFDAAVRRRMRRALLSAQRSFGAVALSAADALLPRVPLLSAFLVDMVRGMPGVPPAFCGRPVFLSLVHWVRWLMRRMIVARCCRVLQARAVAEDPAARGTSPGVGPAGGQPKPPGAQDRAGRTPPLPHGGQRAWRQDVAFVRQLVGCASPAGAVFAARRLRLAP